MQALEMNDGAGCNITLDNDARHIAVTLREGGEVNIAVLTLEQAREVAGWMRQAMAEMKGAL